MSEKVQAGILSTLGGLFKNLCDQTQRVIENLPVSNIQVVDEKKDEDGTLHWRVVQGDPKDPNSRWAHVKLIPIYKDDQGETAEDATHFRMLLETEDGTEFESDKIRHLQIPKQFDKFVREAFDMTVNESTKATKVMCATLQRVESAEGYQIELTAITANYTVGDVMGDLEAALADEAFASTITEEPMVVQITNQGEELEVETITAMPDCRNMCQTMLSAALTLQHNVKTLHWNLAGKGFNDLHRHIDTYGWCIRDAVDVLGELCVELCGEVENPGHLVQTEHLIPGGVPISEEDGYRTLHTAISYFVDTVELYYINFNHDVQSVLDNFIRYWKKERDYAIARRLRI